MNDAYTLQFFFDSWELFRDAALAGTWAGALLGFLGVYVVLRRMVFLSAALSQTAGLGVALAFYLKVELLYRATLTGKIRASDQELPPVDGALDWILRLGTEPYVMAGLVTAAVTAALAWTGRQPSSRRDAALGFVYLVGAGGTLLVGTRIMEELQDIQTILLGNAVAVLPEDLTTLIAITLIIGVVHLIAMRGMVQSSFDPDGASVRGLPVRWLDLLLLGSLALAVVVTTRILGALPVFAFSVLPAMAAIRLSPNVPTALGLAAAFEALAGFCGYLVSFLWEFPVGASQTVLAAMLVVVAEAIRQTFKLIRRYQSSTLEEEAA